MESNGKFKLLGFSPDGSSLELPLEDGIILIGRTPECDLQIRHASVSRSHCELIIDGRWAKIKDLGSSNGTYVNHVKINEQSLKAGDCISIGPVTAVLQINGEPDAISRSMVRALRQEIDGPAGGRFMDTIAGEPIPEDDDATSPPGATLGANESPGNLWLIQVNRKPKPEQEQHEADDEQPQSRLTRWLRKLTE